ncbi:hypothetical protein BCR44DRAFT_1438514 [Catenaria anguillulae PL171]|uniref:Uncharacterized protein n=1 Tax=Catenaria anguillulae PL171 TaxID=765915 RepID=A0A1Y2HFT4_9FUNG|nr:hypothetical protein BCR44DRAFT_1438514 [Catenaria anguillulae PL171]
MSTVVQYEKAARRHSIINRRRNTVAGMNSKDRQPASRTKKKSTTRNPRRCQVKSSRRGRG